MSYDENRMSDLIDGGIHKMNNQEECQHDALETTWHEGRYGDYCSSCGKFLD